MKSEGGEYGGTDGKDYDESKEEEDYSKEVKDLIDEVEREQELEKTNYTDDPQKQDESAEDTNSSKEERETDAPEGNDQEQAETNGEYDEYWRKEAEDCVKDAVKELESEEAEAQAAREADEAEYKEFQESGREARDQSADQDNLSEWEKDVLDNLEDYGIDPEEVRERWRNQFIKDVQDELEGASDEPEPMEKEEEESKAGEEPRHDKPEESESYHDDGSSQMYAMKSESSEATENKVEAEVDETTEGAEQEAAEAPEDPISNERTEQKHRQSEGEEGASQEGEETEQQTRRVAQEGTEEPESMEDAPKKEVVYQKEATRTSTAEYPDDVKEEHGETKVERKVEPSTEHEVYGHGEDASKVIEAHAKQESEEKATESELSDELSPEEESRKRVIDEIFGSLPEEVREGLRKYLEDLIEDEEEFEELARKHGLEKLLEDEEVMEEVREFLRFKRALAASPERSMEELAEELGIDQEQAERWTEQRYHPEAIKKVLRLEGYRILDNLIREIREQDYPEDLEEFEEFLLNNPRLEYEDPMAPFEQWKREARAWVEIMRARREGRIEFRLRNGWEIYSREQMESLGERYGVSKEKIISWLLGRSIPYLITRIGRENVQLDKEINIEEVYRLYFEQGFSMLDIGKKLGFKSPKPILRIFREQGWEARASGPQRQSQDYAEMNQLYYEKGCTLKEIAERFGMDRHTIGKIFKEQGWVTRRAAAIKRGESITEQTATRMSRNRESKSRHTVTKKKSMSKKNHTTLERIIDPLEVYRLYFVDGLTMMDISRKFGFKSTHNVSILFKRMGWKPFNGRAYRGTVDIGEVYRLYYIEGLTKEEVAQELAVPESRLRKVFKEMGWASKIRKFETNEERVLAKKEIAKETSQRIKDLRREKFGSKCQLCGQERKLAIHKKDGNEHERDYLWRAKLLRSVNPDNWAALCIPCHRGVHWMMEALNYNWEDIQTLAQKKQSSKSENLEPINLPEEDTPSSSKYLELKSSFEGNHDELRRAIFGDSCYFCGVSTGEKKIPIHRKDGRNHPVTLITSEKYYRTLNPDEWVSLCSKHHRFVHWAMDTLNLKWDDLKQSNNEEIN